MFHNYVIIVRCQPNNAMIRWPVFGSKPNKILPNSFEMVTVQDYKNCHSRTSKMLCTSCVGVAIITKEFMVLAQLKSYMPYFWGSLSMFGTVFKQVGKSSRMFDQINALAMQYGALLSRQSDQDLPATRFANGIQRGKLMAQEHQGKLLCIGAVLQST